MHPAKVRREQLQLLTDLPNIGPACAEDLQQLGYATPAALHGADPYQLYRDLCALSGSRVDPCMLDVLISVTRFLAGEEARPWWAYTAERKASWATRFGDGC
ncbi:MAG: hypothetical protein RIR00_2194 [Pseudomonadota bacterium]|jgi:hypothetical protein